MRVKPNCRIMTLFVLLAVNFAASLPWAYRGFAGSRPLFRITA